MKQKILIIGATSAIAEATARRWATEGAQLHLLARNVERLELVARDLALRGAQVSSAPFDAAELAHHERVIDEAFKASGGFDVALIAHGDLPDQQACEQDSARLLASLTTNGVSVVSLSALLAQRLRAQGHGALVVIGSVAGDRGRKSNYVYGSAKALVATFLEGLAGRMRGTGVSVINIKPGFVDTPMTAAFRKGLLWAQPDDIARIIQRHAAAARSGGFYAPSFWWPIMWVIRWMPASLLHRLNI